MGFDCILCDKKVNQKHEEGMFQYSKQLISSLDKLINKFCFHFSYWYTMWTHVS